MTTQFQQGKLISIFKKGIFFSFVSALLTSAFAQNLDLKNFNGEFRLHKSVYGMCDNHFSTVVMSMTGPGRSIRSSDVVLGSFRFIGVNEGEKVVEDDFVRLKYETSFDGQTKLSSKTESFKKKSRTTDGETSLAELKGNRLVLKSRFVSKTVGESDLEFETHCIYEKLPSAK